MSEPIKVGDLAMVVFPSKCGHSCGMGRVFTVAAVTDVTPYECSECHSAGGWGAGVEEAGGKWYSMWRVKRIEPPKESLSEGDLAEQRRIHDAWQKDKQPS